MCESKVRRSEGAEAQRRGLEPDLPRLLGGWLCLDFANTIDDRAGERPVDYLTEFADLARWGRHVGELEPAQVHSLLAEAKRRPEAARAALARAVALREAIYRVFRAVAHGEPWTEADLETLRQAYLDALAKARLTKVGGRVDWRWIDQEGDLDRVLWPVASSAIALLTGPDLDRVKQCPGPTGGCAWLFLDTSKNGSRRWCSMEGCGSQAKMRRRYARTKALGVRR